MQGQALGKCNGVIVNFINFHNPLRDRIEPSVVALIKVRRYALYETSAGCFAYVLQLPFLIANTIKQVESMRVKIHGTKLSQLNRADLFRSQTQQIIPENIKRHVSADIEIYVVWHVKPDDIERLVGGVVVRMNRWQDYQRGARNFVADAHDEPPSHVDRNMIAPAVGAKYATGFFIKNEFNHAPDVSIGINDIPESGDRAAKMRWFILGGVQIQAPAYQLLDQVVADAPVAAFPTALRSVNALEVVVTLNQVHVCHAATPIDC